MKVAVIGTGVMGSAFSRHFAKKNSVILFDRDKTKTEALAKEIGAVFQGNVDEAVKSADVVLLAVKPKNLSEIAAAAKAAFTPGKLLISILAGTPLSILKRHFPYASIVRSMPNLAITCGEGVIGLVEDPHLSKDDKKTVESLLEKVGLTVWMSEDKIEALTAISGSGIGFWFVIIEAMIDGGVHLGFTAQESRELVLKTLDGAVAMMRESGKHPAELKLDISSPGGTTMAGLKVMEALGVRSGIIHTLAACHEKALNMMKSLEK